MTAETFTSVAVPSARRITFGMRAAHFAKGNVLFVVGSTIFLVIVLGAIFAPWIAPYDPTAIDFSSKLSPPTFAHLMGCNDLGQDIFSQVLYGARVSLMVGVVVISLALGIGVPIGLLAGFFGGWIVKNMFGGQAIYALVLAGIFMLCAAVSVLYVQDSKDIRFTPTITPPTTTKQITNEEDNIFVADSHGVS